MTWRVVVARSLLSSALPPASMEPRTRFSLKSKCPAGIHFDCRRVMGDFGRIHCDRAPSPQIRAEWTRCSARSVLDKASLPTSQVFRDVADGSCAEGKDTNVVDMLASSCLRLRDD